MADIPLQKAQRRVIQAKLELRSDDRVKVVGKLVEAARHDETRVTMLAVVKFENGEVLVVPDMKAFVRTFEHTRPSAFHQISPDDFSIDLFGTEGEDAYQQSMCLADFFTKTHQGWYLMVRDVVATCKKPHSFWKQIGRAFESREKAYKDYRLVVDLRKTADIRQQSLLAHERFLLFGKPRDASSREQQHSRTSSDTLGSYSSGVFSRGAASGTREAATPVLPPELTQAVSAKESDSSSSESSGDQVLDTSAKEVSVEVDESMKLRKQASSSSLSSSSSKARIVYTLPKWAKK
jgi:hypothetical protein